MKKINFWHNNSGKKNLKTKFKSHFKFKILFALQTFFHMGHFGWMIFHSMRRQRWSKTKRLATKLTKICVSHTGMDVRVFLRIEIKCLDQIEAYKVTCWIFFTLSFVLSRNPRPQMMHLYRSFHASMWIVWCFRNALRLAETLPQTWHVCGPCTCT